MNKGTVKQIMLRNEKGFALITAMMFLAVMTLIAVAASTTTNIESKVSTNMRAHHNAFFTAESGLSYIIATPTLYGSTNIDTSTPLTDSRTLSGNNSFNVSSLYLGPNASNQSMRGSGYSAGKFRAHNYELTSSGNGPISSNSEVMAEGYRIGF
jgi:Tfp pilus assembly protein PilX